MNAFETNLYVGLSSVELYIPLRADTPLSDLVHDIRGGGGGGVGAGGDAAPLDACAEEDGDDPPAGPARCGFDGAAPHPSAPPAAPAGDAVVVRFASLQVRRMAICIRVCSLMHIRIRRAAPQVEGRMRDDYSDIVVDVSPLTVFIAVPPPPPPPPPPAGAAPPEPSPHYARPHPLDMSGDSGSPALLRGRGLATPHAPEAGAPPPPAGRALRVAGVRCVRAHSHMHMSFPYGPHIFDTCAPLCIT